MPVAMCLHMQHGQKVSRGQCHPSIHPCLLCVCVSINHISISMYLCRFYVTNASYLICECEIHHTSTYLYVYICILKIFKEETGKTE